MIDLFTSLLVVFLVSISGYNSVRNRHRLTRSAVGNPLEAPWRRVYFPAGDDPSPDSLEMMHLMAS
jgi:hypothetical protein